MYKQVFRPILSVLGQESSHRVFLTTLRLLDKLPLTRRLIRLSHKYEHPDLHRELFGIDFKNPIGLASGFDTDAECVNGLSDFGFSFIEVGSLSSERQEGAAKPRVIRERSSKALITKLGIRNKGVKYAIENLKKAEDGIVIFGSIAPQSSSHKDDDIINDYKRAFSLLYDFVDVLVVNISCPNANGLLVVQDRSSLADILDPLLEMRLCYEKHKPILIKVSPDTPFEQLDEMIDYCRLYGIDGVIATNFARVHAGMFKNAEEYENLFVSGAPVFEKSLKAVKHIHEHTQGRFPIIGCGGIMNPDQAKQMLDAGATLIQLNSGVVYEGPRLAKHILKSLAPKQ